MRRLSAALIAALIVSGSSAAQLRVAPPGERPDAAALELLLRKLSSTGTFMETDAHPDDEDNGLLAMLGHGQGMRTTLVTLTRGDGGQNEIGPELGPALGVLRTEELLAVHRFDGAEQYFTRAIDFGYSFSVEESIDKWGHDAIVGDLVRHIRTIRPDVIAGFLCGGQAGGLHHQASAQLTREAVRAAANPRKYPEQIQEGLQPWQAARYFCTDETSFAPQPPPRTADLLLADVSGFDPVLGRTYAEIGLEARSMHKCQGTSQLLLLPGQTQNRTYRLQDSTIDQNGVAPTSLFEGINVTLEGLARFAGPNPPPALVSDLHSIAEAVGAARRAAAADGPAAALPALHAIRSLLIDTDAKIILARDDGGYGWRLDDGAGLEISARLERKMDEVASALVIASGTRLDALADDGVVIPGQPINVSVYAAGAAELRGVTLSGFDGQMSTCAGDLAKAVSCKAAVKIPPDTKLSTPYWTPRTDAARDDFESGVPFGVPFRPTPFRATFDLVIGGQPITIERPVEYRYSNITAGEKRSQLNVSPPFSVTVDPEIAVFPAQGATASAIRAKTISVTVVNNQKGAANVSAAVQVPDGWTADPASRAIAFSREEESASVKFTLRPASGMPTGDAAATAFVTSENGVRSGVGYDVVEYPHIHRRHVVHAADVRLKVLDVTVTPGLRVGYVMGVGDRVPDAIEQLGADVMLLDAETLASGDLSRFDTIVLGVRAYERRPDLRANNQRLLKFAADGGTVVVQYQRTEFNEAQYGPFPAKTTAERLTDENAPMEILVQDHPVFTKPNRLGPETWRGWLQERGTYFLGERDSRYVDLLRGRDPFPYNAGTKTGILVEARVGKGRWIYTGLGLWRQLPAGTDGAYRLLANVISLGKQ